MDVSQDEVQPSRSILWKARLKNAQARLRAALPFLGGILAAVLGFAIYNFLRPPAQPLTVGQVEQVIADAMASATPAPAYSAQVFRVIQPSLVLIQSSDLDAGEDEQNSLGSGVVISDQGDILTALHVVAGAEEIQLTFADGSQVAAEIASEQPEIDIAVLHPLEMPELVVPAVLGNPNTMSVGDEAFAVGNPFGLYGSMSAGVISGFERSFRSAELENEIEGLIQIDTAVNPGNSGGPLLNRSGHVVGIVVGILNPTEDDFFIGIGFAVPISIAAGGAGAPLY